MSFQICIKTDKSLHQLATEICNLFSLPPYRQISIFDEPYYQFETLGMLILLHRTDEEDRDPEVRDFNYCFDLQMTFVDHALDTDTMEYSLQPYYAQLLSFRIGLMTSYHEKQKTDRTWKIRYHYCRKNPKWNDSILFGEPGWEPAVIQIQPSAWRPMHPVF